MFLNELILKVSDLSSSCGSRQDASIALSSYIGRSTIAAGDSTWGGISDIAVILSDDQLTATTVIPIGWRSM